MTMNCDSLQQTVLSVAWEIPILLYVTTKSDFVKFVKCTFDLKFLSNPGWNLSGSHIHTSYN